MIEGILEFDYGFIKDNDIIIDVIYLYIYGGRFIIGCDEFVFYEGKVFIVLRGIVSIISYFVIEGFNVGFKVIGKVLLKIIKIFLLRYWGVIVGFVGRGLVFKICV